MNGLNGKRALITGGASGIHLETARQIIKQGARVAIIGRDPETLHAARKELGARPEHEHLAQTETIESRSCHLKGGDMTKKELNKFKTMLTAKQTELTPQPRKRDAIAIEKTSDMLDEIHLASERELMTRNLERESRMLRDVRAALARMQGGAYGTCVNCEEEIGLKRLQAVPWTPLCIACQEQDDQGRGRSQPSWLSLRAA